MAPRELRRQLFGAIQSLDVSGIALEKARETMCIHGICLVWHRIEYTNYTLE